MAPLFLTAYIKYSIIKHMELSNMKKFILIGIAALALAGCQTPSQNIIVENSKNVNIVANNTANPNPGYYYGAPVYAPPVYAAPVYRPTYVGPPIYPNNRCIWTQANNPYYRSRVCY